MPPCLIDAPYLNNSNILGIRIEEWNHSIHSDSCLINKALGINFFSCVQCQVKSKDNKLTMATQ